MSADLDRIADALEQLAEQAVPWVRTRISAPIAFTDRHGRGISAYDDDGIVLVEATPPRRRSSVLFAGTWPQAHRYMDRLFREDITARALAASAEAPTEPAITWRGSDGFVCDDWAETRLYHIDSVVRSAGARAYVWGVGVLYEIAWCADEAAAKALCEAWERAFLAATKEVQS